MKPKKSPSVAPNDVEAFLAALSHPLAREIGEARAVILGASREISEAIKWNAPSFRTTEFFATMHLRSTKEVQIIFHLGAKKRATIPEITLSAPDGMVRWLAKDRCMVVMGKGAEIEARSVALRKLVQAWIAYV